MQAPLRTPRGARRYHTSDPIDNLRVKVTLRQVYEPEPAGADASERKIGGEVGKVYTERFHWQEKRFGPHELIRYQSPTIPNRLSRSDQTYFTFFRKRRALRDDDSFESSMSAMSSSRLFEDAVPNEFVRTMLYTYTDGDTFVAPEETSWRATTSSAPKSTLDIAMTYLNRRSRGAFDKDRVPVQAQKVQAAFLREEPYKVMYIMVALELDAKKAEELLQKQQQLLRNSKQRQGFPRISSSKFVDASEQLQCSHHVLAQIRLYPTGKLEVHPGFADDAGESDDDDQGGYLDDEACVNAAALGPKLATYRFQTSSGRVFEYALENENEVKNHEDQQKIEKHDSELRMKQTRSRLQSRTRSLSKLPFNEAKPLILQVQLSILGLDHFAHGTHPMYVEYETQTPSTWTIESDLKGTTQETQHDRLLPRGEIVGATQRATPSVGFGFGVSYDSAMEIATAHAGDMHHGRARGIGFAIVLVTVMFTALVHGAAKVFWLIYALMMNVTLQLAQHARVNTQLDMDARVYHFAHLIAFRLHGRENVRMRSDSQEVALPQPSPKVYFTISRLRANQVHAIAGYAYVDIPQTAGTYDIQLETWKATDTRYSRMKDFFIGGADRLAHASFAGREIAGAAQAVGDSVRDKEKTDVREEPFLSRLGMVTESSGRLHLRIVVSERRPMTPREVSSGGPGLLQRSVEEVLNEYKKLKQEMSDSVHDELEGRKREHSSTEEQRAYIRTELARARQRREELTAKFEETKARHDSMVPAPSANLSPVPSIAQSGHFPFRKEAIGVLNKTGTSSYMAF